MTTPAAETSTAKTTTILTTTTTTTQIITTTTITTTTITMTTTTNATIARIPNFLVVAGVGVFDMPNFDPREAISEKKSFKLRHQGASWVREFRY